MNIVKAALLLIGAMLGIYYIYLCSRAQMRGWLREYYEHRQTHCIDNEKEEAKEL